jgi:translation initiation factor 1A
MHSISVADEDKEQEYIRIPLPSREKGELFAVVDQLMGGSRIKVVCEDGKARLARIPGRIKKRKWIKNRNLLIVKPWSFQDDKADVVYRYTPTQTTNLARRKIIPENINIY